MRNDGSIAREVCSCGLVSGRTENFTRMVCFSRNCRQAKVPRKIAAPKAALREGLAQGKALSSAVSRPILTGQSLSQAANFGQTDARRALFVKQRLRVGKLIDPGGSGGGVEQLSGWRRHHDPSFITATPLLPFPPSPLGQPLDQSGSSKSASLLARRRCQSWRRR